jgi:hypothetical protein
MESEILPWLRLQDGFLDLITLSAPDGSEVATISFWDQSSSAHAYNAGGYPQALQLLADLLDAAPYVKTFDVVTSSFHKVTRPSESEDEDLPCPLQFGRAFETNA